MERLWWERTFAERHEEFERYFGCSHPPGSPEGHVIAYSWDDIDLMIPGACCMVFPPTDDDRLAIHREWMYVTHGLTQPLSAAQVKEERAAGRKYSGVGFEFAFLLHEPAEWPPQALYLLLTQLKEGVDLKWGDRVMFGLHEPTPAVLRPFTGPAATHGVQSATNAAALLLWPYLAGPRSFATSTGKFFIMVATTIMATEWDWARETTSAHVLYLLFQAGVGQTSDPHRASLSDDERWRSAWAEIRDLDYETVCGRLDTVAARRTR